MSARQKKPSEREWTAYAIIMLLVLFIGAVSQALMVPPAWKPKEGPSQTHKSVVQNPVPPVASLPSHEVVERSHREPERPVASPPSPSLTRRSDICGVWVSATSQKQYDFVCQEQDTFQVRQISGQGPKNRGLGKVTEDGKIEADLIILSKDRTAHLSLQLSEDGQKIEGTWRGDDPIESGQLTFYRVGKE